ncbi:Z1 domain-containing protein [Pedobacter sp. AW31-3R]|uniref:Z1 domain-containing protein n=1 Tax=Pedobacter sp. AW31-3R TaxID=3445781 RepID=UPI003F9F3D2E
MNTILDSARGFAHQFIQFEKSKGNQNISPEVLYQIVDKVAAIGILESIDKDQLFEILTADLSNGSGEITEISDQVKPWLNDAKSGISFKLWSRYKLYMDEKDPSFPINDLDDFTDRILDKCVNPKQEGSWDRRGMVVGHVQSGKTSNYVGLINKATDAGYKLIIIIAGTMNSLRRQTQQRVDEGFAGVNSSTGKVIGVGEIKTDDQIYQLTSSSIIPDGDFEQKAATRKGIPIGKNPVVLVIKKNKSILENLIDWLAANQKTEIVNGEYKLLDVPTLIIDDEADSASVNTVSKKKITKADALEEAKAINKLIRTLLNLFDKNTFIGYTATPYANLFIPKEWSSDLEANVKGKIYKVGEDLFPKDFILNIQAPKNYLGASAIFGYESAESSKTPLDIIRHVDLTQTPFVIATDIDENGDIIYKSPKKDDELPDNLPESIKEAIKAFLLTCAIRRLRGHDKKHNSMLIHVMLYVRWIDRIALLVNEELRKYKDYILGNDGIFLDELKRLFDNDFVPTTTEVKENLKYTDIRIREHAWADVRKELKSAVSKIEVRAVHGTKSNSNLEYKNIKEIDYDEYNGIGLSVIAVGGSRLARGITLEGLSVSYYLRASKMYDTLMQMGRWFGYRPGYADLIRLYTTDTLSQWFNHIAMATENMRGDFDELASLPDVTPRDYMLKVQNHQGLLTITAATKLFWAENISISFSGQNPQTYQLSRSQKVITNNFNAYKQLLRSLGHPSDQNLIKRMDGEISHLIYRDVNTNYLCSFLDSYQINQPSIKNATLSEYIKKQEANRNIKRWNVVFRSNSDKQVFINTTGAKKPDRTPLHDLILYPFFENSEKINIGAVVRNQSPRTLTEHYLISKNQIDDISDRKVDLDDKELKNNNEIKERRQTEGSGLILIYLLDPRGTVNADESMPFVGFSIHFPKIQHEEKVSYTATAISDSDYAQDDDDDKDGEVI